MSLPESALERVLPREHPELIEVFEPNRGLSRQLDLHGQGMLVAWLRLAKIVGERDYVDDELREYCADLASEGYEPADDIDPDRSAIAIAVGCTINGVLEDVEKNGGEARLQEAADLAGHVLALIDKTRAGNPYDEAGKIETTTPSRVAKNVEYCLKGKAPTPDERERRKLEAQLEKEHSQKIIELLRASGGMTAKELGEKFGKRPETIAKWLRPLKKLGVVEQIDDRRAGSTGSGIDSGNEGGSRRARE